MKEEQERARRPGGRSARVRAAVHQAVMSLVAERGYGAFTIGEVAARAGVADTSIYRRWGNLEALTADVAMAWLTAESPIPDTGSLRDDLRSYATQVAGDIVGPEGLAILRLAVSLSASGEEGEQARADFLLERQRQLDAMLDRARDRGEPAPHSMDVVDHILAPMYVRVLFGLTDLGADYVDGLVDHLLAGLPREP
ncbi:TetR/AcrR family transcriptional regulator [Streptomyces varsoviensis]|uniref:TetR family transcriptional regulator n=1 Tax=Streptomyces varsoviensis TaxID=67373 RepID=A0ABR5IRT4_9ACTN|nr:TetR/AcrR family transcriptional regulator [Streptomyces varsoviensis]KOG48210.1 TetR family transcriptional regulator [Streptomyces varsoviensis]